MEIELSEQHLAVLKSKTDEFNANNGGGQALSDSDYATMIVRDTLAVYEADVARRMSEFRVAEFRKFPKEQQEAAVRAVKESKDLNP